MGMVQSQPVPGNNSVTGDFPSALVWLQNNEGPLQFFAMAGGYSFPTLGTKYFHINKITGDTFGPVPVAYAKFVLTDEVSMQVGKLPTLIGAEYGFTFQNMNIERGLLWNQEPIVSRGVQGNYSSGPLTVSLSLNDGFYSNNYSWISGLASYTLNKSNTIAVAGGGAFNAVSKSTFVTPPPQNNSRIINLIYTYNAEPWTITPYFQYTNIPTNVDLGIDSSRTYGGAILANYKINDNINIAGRAEYICVERIRQRPLRRRQFGRLADPDADLSARHLVHPRRSVGHACLRHPDGAAFGNNGNAKTQVRGLIETGIIF